MYPRLITFLGFFFLGLVQSLAQVSITDEETPKFTNAQYELFAKTLSDDINDGNDTFFNNNYDKNAIIRKVLAGGLQLPQVVVSDFAQGITGSFNVGTQVMSSTEQIGSYDLVRMTHNGDIHKALFRLVGPGGTNYHTLNLVESYGKIMISDIYVTSIGETLSALFRRSLLTMAYMADTSGYSVGGLGPRENAYFNKRKVLDYARTSYQKAAYKDVLDTLETLPVMVLTSKDVFAIEVYSAGKLGDLDRIEKALKRYRAQNGDDDMTHLLLIDGYNMAKNTDKAMKEVDLLEASLGGDPWLNMLRAGMMLETGRHDSAEAYAKAVAVQVPHLPGPHLVLWDVYARKGDYKSAIGELNKLLKYKELDVPSYVQSIVKHPGLLASKEMAAWKKANPLETTSTSP